MAKILMIDDDLVILETAKQWLSMESHSVETATTGTKGWELLQQGDFELVLLDWDLPDVNGIDILKRYRGSGGTLPVLMLTGRTSVDFKAEGLDSGADDYMTKPYHMKELAARIRLALRKAESLPAPAKSLGTGNEELLKKADLAGTSLASRYEFLELLGEGGVGMVFKARHPHLDKLVAIKMIHRSELNAEVLARFEQEAKVISRLDHPNIATVYDFGVTEKKLPFMVMEYIEGKALYDMLAEQDGLPLEQGLDLLIQLCDGLSHAHELGVVHRDLKPANIMLKQVAGSSPLAKILDFGCAKLKYHDAKKQQHLTQTGEVIGTPPYMSPEQIQGEDLDQRSDIYAMGCVIYEVVTGSVPHLGHDAVETLVKHMKDDVRPMRIVRPDLKIPAEMEGLVARALAKEPERRQKSIGEVKAGLERIKSKSQAPKSGNWWNFLGKHK